MSNLGKLDTEDMERLAIELRMITTDSHDWAKRVGLPVEILDHIGLSGVRSTMHKMREATKEAINEQDPDDDDELVEVKVDIADVVGSSVVAAYILGFETHKQYGGDDAG